MKNNFLLVKLILGLTSLVVVTGLQQLDLNKTYAVEKNKVKLSMNEIKENKKNKEIQVNMDKKNSQSNVTNNYDKELTEDVVKRVNSVLVSKTYCFINILYNIISNIFKKLSDKSFNIYNDDNCLFLRKFIYDYNNCLVETKLSNPAYDSYKGEVSLLDHILSFCNVFSDGYLFSCIDFILTPKSDVKKDKLTDMAEKFKESSLCVFGIFYHIFCDLESNLKKIISDPEISDKNVAKNERSINRFIKSEHLLYDKQMKNKILNVLINKYYDNEKLKEFRKVLNYNISCWLKVDKEFNQLIDSYVVK